MALEETIPPYDTVLSRTPMQNALKKNIKTTYFKLTLPNTVDKLKVTIWASGTPKQFLLHIHTVFHSCKQMGLDTNIGNAKKAGAIVELDAELTKTEYAQVCSSEKKRNKDNKGWS